MTLNAKQTVIGILGFLFLVTLILVQAMEVSRKRTESGLSEAHLVVPENSRSCVECHAKSTPAIIAHWRGSEHAVKGVGCVECHQAEDGDVDGFTHYGELIATVVTPMDCSRCHEVENEEFQNSHHARAGQILASLDNFLAETVEGSRMPFNPHSPTPGRSSIDEVNGMASVSLGCKQCHGAKIGLRTKDGGFVTVDDLKPGPDGKPTVTTLLANLERDDEGKPLFDTSTWPNTGIGRLNLDGSLGSCSACHSRHDFSPRRARQPENCGKCHMGPDHPQKEIYEESKHGAAFRDLKDQMNLDADKWVLGVDYSAAPTCATCHMSANTRNGEKVTHDPGERISWTNRPPISLVMDTDVHEEVVKLPEGPERDAAVVDTWDQKRDRMKDVCNHCHTPDYVNGFYRQYDDLVVLFNEKFAKPGQAIVTALSENGLITKAQFDDEIEWTWYFLWHHEGRRARHGASMMGPDYTHWHGMFEVSDRFYMQLIPQAREIIAHARESGKTAEADAASAVIEEIMSRPEHKWLKDSQPPAELRYAPGK